MAKFAVGDLAKYIGPAVYGLSPCHIGLVVKIEAIGCGNSPAAIVEGIMQKFPNEQIYKVRWPDDGKAGCIPEKYLAPIPGDSTSLPSWLTNMLKVPQGDPDKVKQPEKVK